MMATQTPDVEIRPEQGKPEHVGYTPEEVIVYTYDATGARYTTHFKKDHNSNTLTVVKRTKTYSQHNQPGQKTETLEKRVTDTVREAVEKRGYKL